MNKGLIKYIKVLLLFASLKINAQEIKTLRFSDLDTSTIEILHEKYTFNNGKIKQIGAFRHTKLRYGKITENYAPIGKHIFYRKNGQIKFIQNYTPIGFLVSDTSYRRNGQIKNDRLFKPEYSILQSDGSNLYFVDRFYTMTFYYKNGNIDCFGPAERTNNTFLIRRDTWKFYNKDGSFKYDLNYKDSKPAEPNNISQDSLIGYNTKLSFALRGKIIGFFILEDLYFATYTLGGELIHNEKHSLGIDGTFFRWKFETDDDEDIGMYSNYERRTYLLVDYKYTFLQFYSTDLYFNIYDKIGNYKMWYRYLQYGYDYGTQDMTFLKSTTMGTFNEPGAGFGIRRYFDDSAFGIDCSANIAYRYTNNDERIYVNMTETNFRDNVKEEKTRFYMRVNLFYNFSR